MGSRSRVLAVAPVPGTRRLERALHWKFLDKRIGGEWFNLDEGDVNLIASITPEVADELVLSSRGKVVPNGSVIPDLASRAINTRSAIQINVELDTEQLDRLKAFAEVRGLTLKHVVGRAIERHLDNPPPLIPDPPLPPCGPDPVKKKTAPKTKRAKK